MPACPPADSIVMLTDDHTDPTRLPTHDNILDGFGWLTNELLPGDSLFFYFSGDCERERARHVFVAGTPARGCPGDGKPAA
jgi:hypothetical protein